MTKLYTGLAGLIAATGLIAGTIGLGSPDAAFALSTKECSAKYKAAKDAGTLGTMKWNDFRKAECAAGDAPAAPEKKAETPKAEPKKAEKKEAAKLATPKISTGGVIFPTKVDAKFAKENAFKQRLHTCSEQWQANKAAGGGGNGNLRWVQKGGGYWPQCNAHLKQ